MKSLNKNKRGAVAILIVILIIGAFGLSMYYASGTYKTIVNFGERPRAMIESYAFGEQARSYMENAVRRATHQAFYEVGYSGSYAASICNYPLQEDICFVYRDTEFLYGFPCEANDLADPESDCSLYGVTEIPFETSGSVTLDCMYVPSYSLECEEMSEKMKAAYDAPNGIKCVKAADTQKVLDSFDCYEGHMEKCNANNIAAGWIGQKFIDSEVFNCDVTDDILGYQESFQCFSSQFDGCESYATSSFHNVEGIHKINTQVKCETVSRDITCGESPCGEVAGHSVWNDGAQDCVPDVEHIETVIDDFLEAQFEKMLYAFPLTNSEEKLYHAASLDLYINVSEAKVIARPAVFNYHSIIFGEDGVPEIAEEEVESMLAFVSELNFTYSISPYFETTVPYNPLTLFATIAETAKSAVSSCGEDGECIMEKVDSKHEFIWRVSVDQGHALFDLESKDNKVLARTPNGELVQKGLPIRFALKA